MPKRQDTLDPSIADLLDQHTAKRDARRRSPHLGPDLKARWQQTNIRMDPAIKQRAKAQAQTLGVPLEEIVHVALTRLLDDLDSGQLELTAQPTVTRNTLLATET